MLRKQGSLREGARRPDQSPAPSSPSSDSADTASDTLTSSSSDWTDSEDESSSGGGQAPVQHRQDLQFVVLNRVRDAADLHRRHPWVELASKTTLDLLAGSKKLESMLAWKKRFVGFGPCASGGVELQFCQVVESAVKEEESGWFMGLLEDKHVGKCKEVVRFSDIEEVRHSRFATTKKLADVCFDIAVTEGTGTTTFLLRAPNHAAKAALMESWNSLIAALRVAGPEVVSEGVSKRFQTKRGGLVQR